MNILKSTVTQNNDILVIKVGEDADEGFVQEVGAYAKSGINLSLIAIDNTFANTMALSLKIALSMKEKAIGVIGICWDLTEDDENGNKTELPIELQLAELKSNMDAIIILKDNDMHENKFAFGHDEVIEMLLTFYKDNSHKQGEKIAKNFKDTGFAYYNSKYREDAWNSEALMDYTIFDTMFKCPLYVANQALCLLEGGYEFAFLEGNDLGDEGIMTSYLEDYLSPQANVNVVSSHVDSMPPFSIKVKLLVFDIEDEYFIFNESGSWQYPNATDERLGKRIDRMMQLPFHNNDKRKKYKSSID